jgi:hypothetical protein
MALLRAGACALLVIAVGVIFAPSSRAQTAPRYEADVDWPKPLPERWVLGGLGGQCVDAQDHVLKRTIAVPWTPVTPPQDGVAEEVGGSAVAVDFSPDKAQRLMFVINQNNSQIEIIERATGKHLGSFGRPGSFPGQFNQVHGISVDSKGNVYLTENRGKRVHKFRPVSQ